MKRLALTVTLAMAFIGCDRKPAFVEKDVQTKRVKIEMETSEVVEDAASAADAESAFADASGAQSSEANVGTAQASNPNAIGSTAVSASSSSSPSVKDNKKSAERRSERGDSAREEVKENEDASSSPEGKAEETGGSKPSHENPSHASEKTGDSDEDDKDGSEAGSIQSCAKQAGVDKSSIIALKGSLPLDIKPTDVFFLHISGNRRFVKLKLSSEESGVKVKAICVFVAGNQSAANLEINLPVTNIFHKGRGNRSKGNIVVLEKGRVEHSFADLAGNQSSFVMRSPHEADCQGFEKRLRGNASSASCSK